MPRTIAVGLEHDPGKGQVDLILLPGETPPEARPGLTTYVPPDLAAALYMLRIAFASHADISTLGGATVVGSDPIWTPAIETRLIEFLEDLGNCPLDSWQGAFNAIKNGPRIAAGHTSAGLAGSLAGKPAICLGAGPSVTPEVLAHVARLQGNHYIFACDAMTHACRYAGITPHFVTMLERVPEMLPLVLGADPSTTLIAMPVIDPKCVAEFQRVCWWWGGDDLYSWLDPTQAIFDCGRSSGTLAIGAAIAAGCSPIYLIGHDLAYARDGTGHSTTAHNDATVGQRVLDQMPTCGLYTLETAEVPGWDGAPVKTNGFWQLFRGDIESMVAGSPARFISAQNGAGARIAGVEPGELPAFGPLERVEPTPALPPSSVVDPLTKVPSLLSDLAAIAETADRACWTLSRGPKDLDHIAKRLAVSKMVSAGNIRLFQYVFRALNSSLSLRLHLRAHVVRDPEQIQRDCLAILARSLPPLSRCLVRDLETLKCHTP
jgi:hypothetical protein